MKISSKIRIGGHDYEVRLVDETVLQKAGDCNFWHQIIRINKSGSTESGRAEVLLHEILEAIDHHNELDLPHRTLTALSQDLFAVIRNNGLDFRDKGV